MPQKKRSAGNGTDQIKIALSCINCMVPTASETGMAAHGLCTVQFAISSPAFSIYTCGTLGWSYLTDSTDSQEVHWGGATWLKAQARKGCKGWCVCVCVCVRWWWWWWYALGPLGLGRLGAGGMVGAAATRFSVVADGAWWQRYDRTIAQRRHTRHTRYVAAGGSCGEGGSVHPCHTAGCSLGDH